MLRDREYQFERLPTTNAYQPSVGGGSNDAFVTKFNSAGNTLAYSTYLGGTSADVGYGIAVDSSGNAYVTGSTRSANFPTTNAYQLTRASTVSEAFVTKLIPQAAPSSTPPTLEEATVTMAWPSP